MCTKSDYFGRMPRFSSLIEKALFGSGPMLCISAFEVVGETVIMTLKQWEQSEPTTRATFVNVKILSVNNSYADDDAGFPWDIIGFECEPLADGRWRFGLTTDAVEYCFEGNWPKVVVESNGEPNQPPGNFS
jgi:hypothetical protein